MKHAAIIGLGLAGVVTIGLAPTAFAVEAEMPAVEEPLVGERVTDDEVVIDTKVAPLLDLLYASPYKDLKLGDTTTVVIAQTLPASYSLVSYMSTGAKCLAPYDAPAADHTKSGDESDADLIERTIVSSGVDADNDGIDDHYAGTYDENGIAACKIKVTDEYGNMDWKYIYIAVGLPKVVPMDDDKTASGDGFDTGATTTVAAPVASAAPAPVAAAAVPTAVADNTVTAAVTLPRTGMSTWLISCLGVGVAAVGVTMVKFSRRRNPIDRRHTFEL